MNFDRINNMSGLLDRYKTYDGILGLRLEAGTKKSYF